MISIIGNPSEQVYSHAKTINIAGKTFKNIKSKNQRKYMQDGEIRKVSYLDTENAHYSIYRHNNKIDQITKSYDTPRPMVFNGKTYNITFSVNNGNGTVYEQINPKTYSVTQIQVDKNGKVIDINEPIENKIANGVKKIFGKIGRKIKNL